MSRQISVTPVGDGYQNPNLRYDFTPPEDAVLTGEMWGNKPIYKRPFPTYTEEPVIDETGKQAWAINPTTLQRIRPLTRKVQTGVEWREFIQMAMPAGHVTCNYDFRPDPEERARNQALEDREAKLDRLLGAMDTLEAAGLDADDILAAAAVVQAESADKPRGRRRDG